MGARAVVGRGAKWLGWAIVGLIALLLLAYVWMTRTDSGLGFVRRQALSAAASNIEGKLYLGRFRIGRGCDVSVDSLELRAPDDSLFLATGPLRARCDMRALFGRRLVLTSVSLERPRVIVSQGRTGVWNYQLVFPRDTMARRDTVKGPGVLLQDVHIRGGQFLLELPWGPSDSLSATQQDSAVRAALADQSREIVRGADTLVRRFRWRDVDLDASELRLASPEETFLVAVRRLTLRQTDPPMQVRDARGTMRLAGDTVHLDLPMFLLAGSHGSAKGTLALGDGPIRYDLRVDADTVSLADLAWIADILPREGGGRSKVHVVSAPSDPNIVEYRLTEMDLVSTNSRLRGAITFGVGGPLLAITNLALDLEPMDMDLVRTLLGGPLPYDFQGTLTGRVVAPGGPLDRFVIDTANVRFDDRTVPGAVSVARASGMIDAGPRPDGVAFRGFRLDVRPFDLRTITALDPELPPLKGTLTGRAILDSAFTDVRFREANLAYVEGGAEPLRATGRGRVTFLERGLRYDLTLDMQPLSFAALATAYPALDSLGSMSGPLVVRGALDALTVETALSGPGGTLEVNGIFDVEAPGYAADGTIRARQLDLGAATSRRAAPRSNLNFASAMDLRGDSLQNLQGGIVLRVDSSRVRDIDIVAAEARVAFADERARIDSFFAFTSVGDVRATGGLSLVRHRRDSVTVVAQSDSVARLLALLRDPSVVANATQAALDSAAKASPVAGALGLTAVIAGSVDTLDILGTVRGQGMQAYGVSAAYMQLDLSLGGLPGVPRGTAALVADSVSAGSVTATSVLASAEFASLDSIRYDVRAAAADSTELRARGTAALGDSLQRVVTIDSLHFRSILVGGGAPLRLVAPTRVTMTPTSIALDTTRIAGLGDGVTAWLTLPDSAPVDGGLLARRVAILDAESGNRDTTAIVNLGARLAGTAARPTLTAGALVLPLIMEEGVRLDSVVVGLVVGGDSARVRAGAVDDGRQLATVDLGVPVKFSLQPFAASFGEGAISGALRADTVRLTRFAPLVPEVRITSGTVSADVLIGGTTRRPLLSGALTMRNGAADSRVFGVRVRDVRGDIRFAQDSVLVTEFSARAGPTDRPGQARLSGFVRLDTLSNPSFALTFVSQDFPVGGLRRTEGIAVDANAQLEGRLSRSTLTGRVFAERGVLRIPALFARDVVGDEDPEFVALLDSLQRRRVRVAAGPSLTTTFLNGLRIQDVNVTIGNNVWLRSPELNVQLTGSLALGTVRDYRTGGSGDNVITLRGDLTTRRGTYNLEAGPIARAFQIEEGSVRFNGDAGLNPALNLNALYVVRTTDPQATTRSQDVRVRATIAGTAQAPTLALSDADGSGMGADQLLSYLVTGESSFDVGSRGAYERLATSELLSRATSSLAGAATGGFFDVVNVQAGSVQEGGIGSRSGIDALATSRLGFGKQLNDRTYVYLNAGMCGFGVLGGGATDFSTVDFAQTIGVTLDYRFNPDLGIQLVQEPGSTALTCSASGPTRGFSPSPRQWGFDVFRVWRF